MLEQIRHAARTAKSLPVRTGIGVILLIHVFASSRQYCRWMACVTEYNLDKPHVAIALLLSILILSYAAFEIVSSLVQKPPSQHDLEMPTPIDQKDIEHHYLQQPSNGHQEFWTDG